MASIRQRHHEDGYDSSVLVFAIEHDEILLVHEVLSWMVCVLAGVSAREFCSAIASELPGVRRQA